MPSNESIKQIVLAAFPSEPVPRQLFWEHAEPTWEFPEDFERIFGGKPWTDISELDWRMCCLGNAFRDILKPSTYLYYLPTLFLEAIDGGDIIVAVEAILPNNARRIPKGSLVGRVLRLAIVGATIRDRIVSRVFASGPLE